MDGHYQAGWTAGGWDEYVHQITTGGTHTLRWTYRKDGSGSGGSDCAWVDHVQWSGDLPDPNGWQEITYTYDPAGRRIEKAVEGQTQVKYLYDGHHCIAEYDANDTLLRKYIHGPAVDEPICMIEVADSNATYYYHYDGLGSCIALTDADANTVQLYEYSVYGPRVGQKSQCRRKSREAIYIMTYSVPKLPCTARVKCLTFFTTRGIVYSVSWSVACRVRTRRRCPNECYATDAGGSSFPEKAVHPWRDRDPHPLVGGIPGICPQP